MTGREFHRVLNQIEEDGFDAAFGTNQFEDVKDEAFHALRRDYVAAADKLRDFLGIDDE